MSWLQRYRVHAPAVAAASLGGALYALGFCGFDVWPLAWICLVPTLWVLDEPHLDAWQVSLLAWLTGLVAHLGCYTWLVGMLRTFGYLPWPLALLGYFLLCLAQSSLFGAWGLLHHMMTRRLGWSPVWAGPVGLVVAEWLYPAIFPSYLSNSQYRQVLVLQSLDVWGPLGLTGLMVLFAAVAVAIGRWWRGVNSAFPWAATATLAVLFAGTLGYGYARIVDMDDTLAHVEPQIAMGLVQTNMGIYEKSENPEEGLRRHRDQSLEAQAQGAQVIVWPESGYYYPIYEGVQNVQQAVLGPLKTPLIFGGLRVGRGREHREIFNTAFLADARGNLLGSYDKTYLLMFGESLPLGEWLPFLYKLSPHTSHFTRGRRTDPLVLDGVRYGMLVCYEDILPHFVRGVMAQSPDVLVNLTNDAWFGRTAEPRIHLALASFRAVEQRRYLVRATNTGVSAIIDPVGRIVAQSPIFTRANVVGNVAPLQGVTVYQRYGDWVGLACLAACIGRGGQIFYRRRGWRLRGVSRGARQRPKTDAPPTRARS